MRYKNILAHKGATWAGAPSSKNWISSGVGDELKCSQNRRGSVTRGPVKSPSVEGYSSTAISILSALTGVETNGSQKLLFVREENQRPKVQSRGRVYEGEGGRCYGQKVLEKFTSIWIERTNRFLPPHFWKDYRWLWDTVFSFCIMGLCENDLLGFRKRTIPSWKFSPVGGAQRPWLRCIYSFHSFLRNFHHQNELLGFMLSPSDLRHHRPN